MSIIITSGPDQNSYIDLETANQRLLACAASFCPIGTQLSPGDEAYLVEACTDMETLWDYMGIPTLNDQALAWPRRYVIKPGFQMPMEPGWNTPYDPVAFIQFKIDYLTPGRSSVPYVDDETIPVRIQEAQALLAVLRKQGGNLVGDDQGNDQGAQYDVGLRIAYVNAVRESADIHKRMSGYAVWIGEGILRTQNV